MKTFVLTIIIVAAGMSYTRAQVLDGKTFHVTLTIVQGERIAGSHWTEDDLHFEGDNLIPQLMREREHFSPSPCEVKVDSSSGEITFSGANKNTSGSNVRWQGMVRGDHIEGSVVWVNTGGTRMYSFTGKLKPR